MIGILIEKDVIINSSDRTVSWLTELTVMRCRNAVIYMNIINNEKVL